MPRALGLKEVADPFVEDQQKGLLPEGPEDAGVELEKSTTTKVFIRRDFVCVPGGKLFLGKTFGITGRWGKPVHNMVKMCFTAENISVLD